MSHSPLWKTIRDTLAAEIAGARYSQGDKLPTEAQLAARFSVNRHTVRQALGALSEEGVVYSRRGSGVFVTNSPIEYPIGKRVRFHQNLSAKGHLGTREITLLETRPADAHETSTLGLSTGESVHVFEGISLSDGMPIAVFRSAFPAARFPDLLPLIENNQSITAALKACGVSDYTRAHTKLTAKLATGLLAMKLKVSERSPVLRSSSVNIDENRAPIEYGITWFAGDRVTLAVNDEQAPDRT